MEIIFIKYIWRIQRTFLNKNTITPTGTTPHVEGGQVVRWSSGQVVKWSGGQVGEIEKKVHILDDSAHIFENLTRRWW